MKYVLDTNIIILYIRDALTKQYIETTYQPFSLPNIPIISVVTLGEIESFARQNNWGQRKLSKLNDFLNELIVTDINSKDVIQRYAEIDTFSQGRMSTKPLGMSARNMGKNDLWIAATASVTGATLLTTDADFSHLDAHFLELAKIDLVK